MKRCLFTMLLFLLAIPVFATEPVKVLSFNVRYGNAKDGENSWGNRKEALLEFIKEGKYDFIGAQEVLFSGEPETDQVAFLKEKLPDYGILVRSREASENRGEACPILYIKSRFEPDSVEQGTFWLSDTPEKEASNTWNAACNRIVTWARFHEVDLDKKRTGKSIYVFNTHFDHVSEMARQKSALLILNRIHDRKDKESPIILTGDFNAGQKSVAIRFLKGSEVTVEDKRFTPPLKLIDTFDVIHPDEKFVVSFNAFKEPNKNGDKIDYIFGLPGTEVKEATIHREKRDDRYISDHFPVTATIIIP